MITALSRVRLPQAWGSGKWRAGLAFLGLFLFGAMVDVEPVEAGRAAPRSYLDDPYMHVVVIFRRDLAEHMAAIDRAERKLERRLRSWGSYEGVSSIRGRGRTGDVHRRADWAGKRLIPDADEYSVKNLISAMVRYQIRRIIPDFRGYVRIVIDEMRVANHPVAYLRAGASYVRGSVEVVDYKGHTLGRLSADSGAARIGYTVDPYYGGPDLLFPDEDVSTRVGPSLALFVARSFARIWPDKAEQLAAPLLYRGSGGSQALLP